MNNVNLKTSETVVDVTGKTTVDAKSSIAKRLGAGETQADILRKALASVELLSDPKVRNQLPIEILEKLNEIDKSQKISARSKQDPFTLNYEDPSAEKVEEWISKNLTKQGDKIQKSNDLTILSKRIAKTRGFEVARYHVSSKKK
tara:strand:+ start:50 stop:484 length:435 start_codon:yes stop_codon:yes gene_type:complete